MTCEIEITVRGYHEDHFQHVNHARYLEFLEEGRWAYLERYDLLERLVRAKGVQLAAVRLLINYRRSSVAGDRLRVITGIHDVRSRKLIMRQRILDVDSGKLVVDAEVTIVLVDARTGRVMQIGDDVIGLWPDLARHPMNEPPGSES